MSSPDSNRGAEQPDTDHPGGHSTSLTLGVNVARGQRSLSWTGTGALIPCEEKASDVFGKLFLQGSPSEVREQVRRLDRGRSVMDAVAGQLGDLRRTLGTPDRERLDQYLTGVRDLEKRMLASREWEYRPKPKVDAQPPGPLNDTDLAGTYRAQFDVIRLAFETDSTRVIAFGAYGYGLVPKIQALEDVELTHESLGTAVGSRLDRTMAETITFTATRTSIVVLLLSTIVKGRPV